MLLIVVAYSPALGGHFVWDDELLVQKNPLVTGEAHLGNIWFKTDFSLTAVALWCQWLLWGNQPLGYHVVNVLLHATSCLLLWRLLRRWEISGAWLAAALFAVHPVAAASVAWISEMKNTLSLVLFLTALRLYPLGGKDGKANPWQYLLSLGTFLLALLSKTSTVMLPVVLLLVTWWRNGRVSRKDILRTAPFFALSLLLGCATVWFQHRVMTATDPAQTESLPARFALAGNALWFYLGKALLPVNLSMIYPRWTLTSLSVLAWVPTLLWLGMLGALWQFRQRPEVRAALLALAVFTVTLFPVMGLLSMDYLVIARVSDHFQYLPLLAVVVLLAAAMHRWLPSAMLAPATTSIVLLLAFGTFQRAEILARDESLWRDTLARNPNSFTAHNNLGCFLARQNRLPAAIAEFEATLQLRSNNAPAHANLGRAYAMQQNFAAANPHFEAALKLKPDSAEFHDAYANALAAQGRLPEAAGHLRDAIRLDARPESRLHLAALLRATGDVRGALEHYRAALKQSPDLVEGLNNAAWLLATSPEAALRNGPEAVRFAERAYELTRRSDAAMLGTLSAAYAEAGRFPDAVAAAERAIQVAESAGQGEFVTMLRQMLAQYRAGKPFRESAP
ncbi:MAG: tetratricopeptide repeat protein [Verrucomicrobiota bacterium]